VAEAHEPVAAVQRVLDPLLGVAGLLDAVEHLEHARRRAAVQRARQRADRARQRGGDVGAGRGDDAGGERRGVHAVLAAEIQ
jgi:sRNA-binding protein